MFTVIIKPMSYKCLFIIKIKHNYQIRYMDMIMAFLYGFFDKVIYVKQSHLFTTKLNKVYKLIKALYKLKQAPYI